MVDDDNNTDDNNNNNIQTQKQTNNNVEDILNGIDVENIMNDIDNDKNNSNNVEDMVDHHNNAITIQSPSSSSLRTTITDTTCRTLLAIPNRIWWEDGGQIYFDNESDPFFNDPVVQLYILVRAVMLRINLSYLNVTLDECVIITTIRIKISVDTTTVRLQDNSLGSIVPIVYVCETDRNTMEVDKTIPLELHISLEAYEQPDIAYDIPSDIGKLDRVIEISLQHGVCRSIHPDIAHMKRLRSINVHCGWIGGIHVFPAFPIMPNIKNLKIDRRSWRSWGRANCPSCHGLILALRQSFPSLSSLAIYHSIKDDGIHQSILDLLSHEGNMLPFSSSLVELRWPTSKSQFDGTQLQQLLFDALPNFPCVKLLCLAGPPGNNPYSLNVEALGSIARRIRQEGEYTTFESLEQTKKKSNLVVLNISCTALEDSIRISMSDEDEHPPEVSEIAVDDLCTVLDYFNSISHIGCSRRYQNGQLIRVKLHHRIESKLAINGSFRRFFKDKSVPLSRWPHILARTEHGSLYYALRHGPALYGLLLSLSTDDSEKERIKKKKKVD